MMRATSIALIVALSLAASLGASSPTPVVDQLSLGDPAPALSGGRWLRGELGPWQKGRTYLLDFWATWCAPCITLMPAHQSLQDRYAERGLRVVGIAIWSRKGPTTPSEALARHPDLTYPVIEDTDGSLARTYMGGTASGGLPTVMVVDRTGALTWVGDPGPGLEGVLEAVLEGSFDMAAAQESDQARRRSQALFEQIDEHRRAGQPRDAADLVDAVIALDQERNGWAYSMKYEILAGDAGDPTAAAAVAEQFLAAVPGRNHFFNFAFAYRLLNSKALAEVMDLKLALHLAERAVELAPEPTPDYLALLARVHLLSGERDRAVQRQREAVDAASGAERTALQETLETYLESAEPSR